MTNLANKTARSSVFNSETSMESVKHRTVTTNGIRQHYINASWTNIGQTSYLSNQFTGIW
jgi:hypothetical protein